VNTFEHLENVAEASGWSKGRIVAAGERERDYLSKELLRNQPDARLSFYVVSEALDRELPDRRQAA
jgi:hypothetical protein